MKSGAYAWRTTPDFAVLAAAIWNVTVFLLGSDIWAETENSLRQRNDVAQMRTI